MNESSCRALLVLPAANTTMADEIAALCPWLGALSVARVPSPPQGIAKDLPGYRANTLQSVRPFLAERPNLIIFGCTAAGFYGGPEGNAETVGALRDLTQADVVSTSDAMVDVLRHEKASRVAVVTPYAQDINEQLTAYVQGAGLTVTNLDSFLCATSAELLAITEEQVLEKSLATDLSGADALFIACSQMPTLHIMPVLRETLGLPVWSSISATAWAARRAWTRAASRQRADA